MDIKKLENIAASIRVNIIKSTNQASSGHPTSSLSAVELMTGLMFADIFRYDPSECDHPNNDRLIFSKGHASPLFYALWQAAGQISEDELLTYREFGSRLEGHPVMSFPFTEAATGSLGQGLSVGFGMALNAKYLDKLPYRTYVLLGDSEMAEGSQWEAIQLAAHYQLDNLIGVLDVNRLGQRGETMYGHDIIEYEKRISAFGWKTVLVQDGHSMMEVVDAYHQALDASGKPVMIIARTIKGKGVPDIEDSNGYHGKALGEDALDQLGGEREKLTPVRGTPAVPEDRRPEQSKPKSSGKIKYNIGDQTATRDAWGTALKRIVPRFPDLVALDGEVSNSTRAEKFREEYPDRFFEMYIAEQNMVGAAIGLNRRGKRPFVSTFAAFLTRAFDQIRMSCYSGVSITFAGSHAGASIGKDGPSQMGLEDIALFRTLLDSTVLYPSDAVAAEKLIEQAADYPYISYIRLTRGKTPVIYDHDEGFPIGGSKTLHESREDAVTLVTAGYTLHEALDAWETLDNQGIRVRVIDLYSIKPIDQATLKRAAQDTGRILIAEDHFVEGGMGDAVFSALRGDQVQFKHLAVDHQPGSGPTDEVLADLNLTAESMVRAVKELID